MPTSSAETWYCENIIAGPWPFLLLIIPLVGAYLYGRNKHRLAWTLIGFWIAIQIPMSFVNNVMVNCAGDESEPPPMTEAVPDQPSPAPPTLK